MRSSNDDGLGRSVDPAGEPSGNPASVAAIEAAGLADWVKSPLDVSATGGTVASALGQNSWALYHAARDPYVLLITIYLFAPYFVNVVVGDGVRGQALAGDIMAAAGIVIAILAPFLGAIADSGGRGKPWIAFYTLIMAAAMLPLWFAMPHATGWNLFFVGVLVATATVAYEFSTVFHNALLPSIATPRGVARLSGLGYALGNAAGILLLLFMLICFALPGEISLPFIPAHPLFGISHALHEPERLSGPVAAIWLLIFCVPLFLFTPDRPSSKMGLLAAMRSGVRSVIGTTRSLKHHRNIGMYLLARLFFNDGMTAVLTFGGIYASSTFH